MGRKKRVDFPGAWHHVMNRGGRHAPIFADDDDCLLLIDVFERGCARHGLEVHAYSLMPNHFHFLIRSTLGELPQAMRFIGAQFTRQVNKRHQGWDGSVFKGRYKSQLVGDERYLTYLLAYLHLNPVRARLVARPDAPCWTSHRAYLGLDEAPSFLNTALFHQLLGGPAGVDAFVREIHVGRRPWPDALDTDTGWLTEGEATRAPVLVQPAPTPRLTPTEAERRIRKITKKTRAELREVQRGPRANPARRFAVWAFRQSTSMSFGDIGRRLGMSRNQASKVSDRLRAGPASERVARWQEAWHDHPD